jgi:uncharacterized protein (DUF433 family)
MLKQFPLLERNAEILGGKPVVKGTRISVAIILEWLGSGGTPQTIHQAYPQVSEEAVRQALLYASELAAASESYDLILAA